MSEEKANKTFEQASGSYLISRDEMNLAEFPLTVLSTRADPKLKTLEFSDVITSVNSKPVKRSWIITGADKFGLPTASDDEVLLGLLKLSVEDAFNNQKVYFTRYELLKILRWTTEGRSYSRLQKALDRLSGVRIKATNAFYDNQTKSHSTKNFGIIDAYELNDARDQGTKKSFFIWSEELFNSFKVGFIKKLDLDFYLDLKSAVSKRLFRYLDKNFWYRSRIKVNIFTLAHEKIGISRNYCYASSLKQQIDPALDELIASGFLAGYEYQGQGKNTEVIISAARLKPRSQERLTSSTADPAPLQNEVQDIDIQAALVARGLRESQVNNILKKSDSNSIKRIKDIIAYFDILLANKSPLVSRSPVGFLFRAVEQPFKFVLPADQEPKKAKPVKQAKVTNNLIDEYHKYRENQIDELLTVIDKKLLAQLADEIRSSLNNVKKIISAARFEDTVQHGVREKVADLFAVATYEEWQVAKKSANS